MNAFSRSCTSESYTHRSTCKRNVGFDILDLKRFPNQKVFHELKLVSFLTPVFGLKQPMFWVCFWGQQSQEHSAELKDLAMEDAVKSTLGQKKQLEAQPRDVSHAHRKWNQGVLLAVSAWCQVGNSYVLKAWNTIIFVFFGIHWLLTGENTSRDICQQEVGMDTWGNTKRQWIWVLSCNFKASWIACWRVCRCMCLYYVYTHTHGCML